MTTGRQAYTRVIVIAQKRGLQVAEILRKARVSRTTLWQWQNELAIPNYSTILRIEVAAEMISALKKRKAKTNKMNNR